MVLMTSPCLLGAHPAAAFKNVTANPKVVVLFRDCPNKSRPGAFTVATVHDNGSVRIGHGAHLPAELEKIPSAKARRRHQD